MNDTVLIVAIVAAAVVIVLYVFRRQLSEFVFKATRSGVEAQLKTHAPDAGASTGEPAPTRSTVVSGNRLVGRRNTIDVEGRDAEVSDNTLAGSDQGIDVSTRPAAKQR
jgi:hypothetical protein